MAKQAAQHVGDGDAASAGCEFDAVAPRNGEADREPGDGEILCTGKCAEHIGLVAVRPTCVVYRHGHGSDCSAARPEPERGRGCDAPLGGGHCSLAGIRR